MRGSAVENHANPLRIRSKTGSEDVHYPLQYEGISEKAKLYAERELNETEENKAKGIRKLNKYMKRENLTCPDDRMLIIVLRNCKYDLKKSKTKLKRFLKVRQVISNKLSQIDMDTISLLLDELIFVALPFRDSHGRIIIYTQPKPSIDNYDREAIVFCGLANLLFIMSFPMSSICGAVQLGECHAIHLPVFYSVFKVLKILITHLKDIPLRIGRIDLFNEHFLCHWGLKILHPFMPEKIRKRVMLHGSGFDSVHKVFHPDILPHELGGTLDPLSVKHYKEGLLRFIERLRDESCKEKSLHDGTLS